ncbi:MAG: hypothetical protein JXQ96_03580 [Cyclobacteriaceae bacterium]
MKRFNPLIQLILLSLLIVGFFASWDSCNPRKLYLSASAPEIYKTQETKILTAFFGLDNGLMQRARAIYSNAPGMDRMPLVFSHELDPNTIEAVDFAVTTINGTVFEVEVVSLFPANEEFELRT